MRKPQEHFLKRLHGQFLNLFRRIHTSSFSQVTSLLSGLTTLSRIWYFDGIYHLRWLERRKTLRLPIFLNPEVSNGYYGTKTWLTNSNRYSSYLFVYIKYIRITNWTVYTLYNVLKIIWKFELLCTGSKSQAWRTFKPVIQDHTMLLMVVTVN